MRLTYPAFHFEIKGCSRINYVIQIKGVTLKIWEKLVFKVMPLIICCSQSQSDFGRHWAGDPVSLRSCSVTSIYFLRKVAELVGLFFVAVPARLSS
jgi:hypothetical protein